MAENTLILTEAQAAPGVALLRLNRPAELNAISTPLMHELAQVLAGLEQDDAVRAVVLTGNERAFAAGADIKEMTEANTMQMWQRDQFTVWDKVAQFKKPLIAAVAGFALGGGCELAMACDMIVAADNAQFGQPEIKLGVIPGAGGTQRLTRAIGKARAMELILSGKMIDATQALAWGLVNKVVPVSTYLKEALRFAGQFSDYSPLALRAAKEAINGSYEAHLTPAMLEERRLFYLLFSSEDQREGMSAFVEKRKAAFAGK